MGVIVIGAGIAGVTCAAELAARGVDVTVYERSREVGGRLAVHRHGGRPADIGAAYFTVSDDRFDARVRRWRDDGLVRGWTDTLAVFDGATRGPDGPGPLRFAAPAGLRSLVTDAARGLDVRTWPDRRAGPSRPGRPDSRRRARRRRRPGDARPAGRPAARPGHPRGRRGRRAGVEPGARPDCRVHRPGLAAAARGVRQRPPRPVPRRRRRRPPRRRRAGARRALHRRPGARPRRRSRRRGSRDDRRGP